MKKFSTVLLVIVSIFVIFTSSVNAHGENPPITQNMLSEDSEFIGSYDAVFCHLSQCWADDGQYKAWELLFTPRVYTTYLIGDRAYLSLYTKSGYKWILKEANLFHREGMFLVKSKN